MKRAQPLFNDPKERWNKFLFEKALDWLEELGRVKDSEKVIVEIGAIRDRSPKAPAADGYSTLHWAKTDHQVFAIDTSRRALEITRDVLNGKGNVHLVNQDALSWLRHLKNDPMKIDLLYLDGPDPDENGQRFALECFKVANLAQRCVVLIDDCDFEDGGKGKYVVPYAVEKGFEKTTNGRQVLLVRHGLGVSQKTRKHR